MNTNNFINGKWNSAGTDAGRPSWLSIASTRNFDLFVLDHVWLISKQEEFEHVSFPLLSWFQAFSAAIRGSVTPVVEENIVLMAVEECGDGLRF